MSARARILVVDDNPTNAKLMRAVLAPCGYEVRTASDAASAAVEVAEARPDLILMDIQLPGTDGLEVTRRLKADPATRAIPVLAVTAYAMRGDEERALGAGCDGYMTKPIDSHALRERVRELLEARRPPLPVGGSDATSASGDPRRLLLVEDNPITRRAVARVLSAQGWSVVEADSGAEAIRTFDSARPELVLLDLRLPDVDGMELLERLRARPGGADVPVLAFSGLLTKYDSARISGAGFDDVIPKPIEPAALLAVVSAHLPRRDSLDPSSGETKRRVLVVDDDPVQLKLVALRLGRLGFEVERSPHGRAALAQARVQRPDVVLSDIMMPELDGFGLCMALRGDPALADVPIILTTSTYVERSDRELAQRAGATDYVVRTPDLEEVVHAVRTALGGRKRRISTQSLPSMNVSPPIPAEVEREHMARIVKQLERQVSINAAMAQRCATLGAALSVLGGVADALVQRSDARLAIDDVLAACFDAGGISFGLLELRGAGAEREVHVHGGDRDGSGQLPRELLDAAARCETLTRLPLGARAETAVGRRLGREGLRSALIVPLVHREERIGTLLLGAHADTFEQEEGVSFARGIASQITQAVVLTRAFEGLERARTEAREHARVLESVVESVAEGILVLDENGEVTMATHHAESILGGVPRGRPERWPEQLGLRAADLVSPFDAARLPVVRALRGEVVDAEEMYVRRPGGAGGERWVQMSARALIDDAGVPRGAVAVVRDATKEKEIQAQLMASERMATMGTLAAGVAHEINNPLAAALANLDFVADARESGRGLDPEVAAAADEARDAATRVRDIVRDLRIFSRAEDDAVGPVDVHRTLDGSARMAWTEIKHRARLIKEYRASLPALANEARLGQVLLNLIVNAAQAIPLGHADEHQITLRTSMDGTERVVIEVGDTGQGMTPEVLARAFTPFFTTKPAGVGTGLGLAICRRLILAMGGTIDAQSEPGRGTTFRVVLPATDPARGSMPKMSLRPSKQRSAKIMVVDDDPLVLSALRRRLAKSHEVRTVHDAREALEVLDSEVFDAVLCDLMMPVMSGIEFYREVERRLPAMVQRIVFVTGGAFTAESRVFLESVRNPRLEKPFAPEDLERVLDRVLASR